VRLYDLLLTLHVLAVVVGLGPTFAYPFLQVAAERSAPRSIPYFARVMQRIDRIFVIPALLLIPATGILVVVEGGLSFGLPWVSAGFLVIAILLVLELAILLPCERRMADLAERDIAASGGAEPALSAEYRAVSRRFAMVGGFASLLVVIAVVVMVLKPGG
jgi:uncharacterized membrane protein